MDKIKGLLEERGLPDLLCGAKNESELRKRQDEIRKLLAERQYGEIPAKPEHMDVEVTSEYERFAAGLAMRKYLKFNFKNGETEFSFPAMSIIPKKEGKYPAFIYIDFDGGEANKYMPAEEIVERGFALFTFSYKNATSDDNNFKNGIAKHLVKSRKNNAAPGKIALWAWCAMRVMDYVETLSDVIDLDNVAVIGHSRLGKTALVTGGYDERFKYVISNDSGCAGAAIERGKIGETYQVISRVFPYWFCPKFNKDAAAEAELPFDQHYLMALTVPRDLIIGSAKEDTWADPTSEFLGAASLEEAYGLSGKRGLVHNGEVPAPRSVLDEGSASYYVREGSHYLSRHDWHTYMDIIEKKMKA